MPGIFWDEITFAFPNFKKKRKKKLLNGYTAEFREWIGDLSRTL